MTPNDSSCSGHYGNICGDRALAESRREVDAILADEAITWAHPFLPGDRLIRHT